MASLTEEQIKEAFTLFDADGTLAIDVEEMGLAMRCLGFGELSRDDVEKAMRGIELNSRNLIEYEEFKKAMTQKMAQKDSNEEINLAFELFDLDKSGKISFDNLKEIARLIGEEPSEVALLEMLKEACAETEAERELEKEREREREREKAELLKSEKDKERQTKDKGKEKEKEKEREKEEKDAKDAADKEKEKPQTEEEKQQAKEKEMEKQREKERRIALERQVSADEFKSMMAQMRGK